MRRPGLADQWGDSGAISTRSIKADTGYVEFQVGETTHSRMAGLSHVDTNQHFTTIQFGILLPRLVPQWSRAGLRERCPAVYLDIGYNGIDGRRVPRRGHRQRRHANGPLSQERQRDVHEFAAVTYPLVLDTAFFHDGKATVNVSIRDTFWTHAAGAEPIGGNLFATVDASDWGSSGACSIRSIPSGNGYVASLRRRRPIARRRQAPNSSDSSPHLNDIAFAIALTADSRVYVYENGPYAVTSMDYVAGDTFRVEVAGNPRALRVQRTVFYTSTVTPTFPLFADRRTDQSGRDDQERDAGAHSRRGIPRDPLSGLRSTLTQAEWDRVRGRGRHSQDRPTNHGDYGITGNPVATIGAALTASTGNDALRYHQPVTGWSVLPSCSRTTLARRTCSSRGRSQSGPIRPSSRHCMFSYASVEIPAGTRRIMVIAGASAQRDATEHDRQRPPALALRRH